MTSLIPPAQQNSPQATGPSPVDQPPPPAKSSAVQAAEEIVDSLNKLRNRAQIISALKHLCSIARNILNNPEESEPRKVYKDDDVLVEDLFALPEAADLLRTMGFREEESCFSYESESNDQLASISAMLANKKDALTLNKNQNPAIAVQPTPPPQRPPREVISSAEAYRRQQEAAAERIKEQMRLDRLERQKDKEYEAIRSKNPAVSQSLKTAPKAPQAVQEQPDISEKQGIEPKGPQHRYASLIKTARTTSQSPTERSCSAWASDSQNE